MCVSVWVVKVVAPFLLYVCIMCVCGDWNVFCLICTRKNRPATTQVRNSLVLRGFPASWSEKGLKCHPLFLALGLLRHRLNELLKRVAKDVPII